MHGCPLAVMVSGLQPRRNLGKADFPCFKAKSPATQALILTEVGHQEKFQCHHQLFVLFGLVLVLVLVFPRIQKYRMDYWEDCPCGPEAAFRCS